MAELIGLSCGEDCCSEGAQLFVDLVLVLRIAFSAKFGEHYNCFLFRHVFFAFACA
jgi:hypothetical protein